MFMLVAVSGTDISIFDKIDFHTMPIHDKLT